MTSRKSILLRTRIAFLAVVLFALAILVKLLYIQLVQGHYWKQQGQHTGIAYRSTRPTRGNVYADDGSLLATSLPFYRVALDPCVADDATYEAHLKALSQRLANFYKDRSAEAYQALIHDARRMKKRYIMLNKRCINYQEKQQMRQWPIFCLGRWNGGIIFEKVEKRFKPFGGLAARTVGFVNDNEAGAGLEYSFNKELKGIPGKALCQKTVGGNWKVIRNASTILPTNGYDIETTLDVDLQDLAHSSLLKALQASEAAYGCALVMETKTGQLKAMVNLSRTDTGQYRERYNYAVGSQGTTEPGSTFKLVSILALLEEKAVDLNDTIDTSGGTYQFYDRVMKDVKRGGYGEITVQEAFEKSSNTAISRLVQEAFGDNPQKFINYIAQLKLSKPLGFQMVGEGIPLIKTPQSANWSGVTLPWMSIGYELQVTPLQILTLYNAIANDGIMVRPIIVKSIKKAQRVIKRFRGEVLNRKICSHATLQQLKQILEKSVERGTARRIRKGYYRIAGKTGTSNKVVDGRYTNDTFISFAGYFPAEAPKYSCIVVIDSPKGYSWHFGSAVSTVFREIVDKLAARDLALRPIAAEREASTQQSFPRIRAGKRTELALISQYLNLDYREENGDAESSPWVRTAVEDDTIVWKPNAVSAQHIPHVIGMTLRDALFLLENRGVKVKIQGPKSGRVKTQSLLPGTQIGPAQSITLQF